MRNWSEVVWCNIFSTLSPCMFSRNGLLGCQDGERIGMTLSNVINIIEFFIYRLCDKFNSIFGDVDHLGLIFT